jgi:phosphate transport system protein
MQGRESGELKSPPARGRDRGKAMTQHLTRQVQRLNQKVLHVGSLVEEAIAAAAASLVQRDETAARRVIANDARIDRLEVEVEEECLQTLALYQPVAADLRFVVAVLKINNDLERMGDLARNIAKRVVYLARVEPILVQADFRTMAELTQAMVKSALDALVNRDATLARKVRHDDEHVDRMRKEIHERVRAEIRERPERTEHLLKLYSAAKHFERIADYATNIAEDVIYMVEGEIVRHSEDD